MTLMPPLSHIPLSTLQAWHAEQQPLVRALASPMVEEMASALVMLQDAIDEREALLAEQSVLIAALQERQGHIELTAEVTRAELQAAAAGFKASQSEVVDLTAKLHATTDRIDVMERRLFGRRSETRKPKTPDARRGARKRRRGELSDEEKKARAGAVAKKRQAQLDALRTVKHSVVVPEAFEAGRVLPPLLSVVYEWCPGELVRVEVSREQRVMPEGYIVTAPPVDQVIEGGGYGPALYAKICVDKCLNALPLRRQEKAFSRLQAPLSASTLCALFHRAGDLIEPIYRALLGHVSASPHVHADETPMPVIAEGGTHRSWMWVFATGEALLFVYSESRGKGTPETVLGGSQGTLVADGYTAYNSITGELGRKRGGCWSHARRGLYEVRSHDPTFLEPVLNDIDKLFYLEELASDRSIVGTPAHLALRAEESQPVIARIFDALNAYNDTVTDGRASVTKAVRYVLNQAEPLTLFLTEPAVPIHNNLSERSLRIVALLRKNSLFAGHDEAAQRFAQLLSLLATCQLHDVNPEHWLADVLLAVGEPGLIAEDLLPWNWKAKREAGYRPYYDTT